MVTKKEVAGYELVETRYKLKLRNSVEIGNEKWVSEISLRQVTGGHYKFFIRTKVVNKDTNKERKKRTVRTLMSERTYISRLLGADRFRYKGVPNIEKYITKHVKKLASKTDAMNSEKEKLEKGLEGFYNDMENLDFEQIVQENR